MDNDINFLTGIKDQHLKFAKKQVTIESDGTHIIHLIQTYPMKCPHCGQLMRRNGFKKRHVHIKILPIAGSPAVLDIKKQQYICPRSTSCPQVVTAVAKVSGIHPGCRIAQVVKRKILCHLQENISQSEIARLNNVSANTVERVLRTCHDNFKVVRQWLPKAIAFDDFKSGKFAHSGMSMLLMNPMNHRLIDIIKSRQSRSMYHYFLNHFTAKARNSVRLVVVDLFQPYRRLIHHVFPHAIIIADHFHVVAQAYRALQQVRIKVMNTYGSGTHEYQALKHFWKLLLQRIDDLDFTHYYRRRNFGYSQLSNSEVVDRLLAMSPQLATAYNYYQTLISAMDTGNLNELNQLLSITWTTLPFQFQRVQRTLRRHKQEIINSFAYDLTNGVIEGTNNKIKVIKRTAFGFRNFYNFRLRILLACSTAFLPKQKTA